MNEGIASGLVKSAPPRILGYKLRPLSAAHSLALTASGWPGIGEPRHLIIALDLLSRPIDPATCLPASFPDRSPGWMGYLRLAWIACRPQAYFRAAARFAEYWQEQSEGPKMSKAKGGGGSSFTGDETLGAVLLGMEAGLTRFEAWSMPVGSLNSYVAQSAVVRGRGARIRDEQAEANDLAKHEKLMEQIKANG